MEDSWVGKISVRAWLGLSGVLMAGIVSVRVGAGMEGHWTGIVSVRARDGLEVHCARIMNVRPRAGVDGSRLGQSV